MSDDFDTLAKAAGGAGGGGLIAVMVSRLLRGSEMSELKSEVKEAIGDLKSDFKEQMTALRELMARNDDRHDRAISEVAQLSMKVSACHQRLDTMEHEVRELRRQVEK